MLDLHVPQPTHSWKDFFIHVATICVGLLIAVSLEQSVELIHRHHQIHQLEAALRAESLENRHVVKDDLVTIDAANQTAAANIALLLHLRDTGAPPTPSLTPLADDNLFAPIDPAWLGMRDNALIAIVPRRLADNYWKLDFTAQHAVFYIQQTGQSRDRFMALEKLQSPSAPMSAADRDALLLALSEYT